MLLDAWGCSLNHVPLLCLATELPHDYLFIFQLETQNSQLETESCPLQVEQQIGHSYLIDLHSKAKGGLYYGCMKFNSLLLVQTIHLIDFSGRMWC